MKKLFMTCGLLMVITMCATSVMAQNAPTNPPPPGQAPGGPARQMLTPEQRADKQTEMMQKNLGLSNDQVTKVKQINLSYWTQVDQLRSNNSSGASASADHQDMRTQMKALRDKRDADLKATLTPDQYSKMQEQMQNRGPQQRPGMPPPAPQQPNQN
jgi:protein CpxP